MHYRSLGRTGLRVSVVGLGTGGPRRFGQDTGLSQEDQTALVRRALDLGINVFDTASLYGRSESILGRALRDIPREAFILSTKWSPLGEDTAQGADGDRGGVVPDPGALALSVEKSLRLLRTDTIDIMHFHGLCAPHYDEVFERFAPVMERLRSAGKIRFVGMTVRYKSDPNHEGAVTALRRNPEWWDVIMLKYGILNQAAAARILPTAIEHDTGVMNMAPVRTKLPNAKKLVAAVTDWVQRGILSPNALSPIDPLGWLVHGDVESVVEAGYRFAADHPAIGTVLTGTADLAHLEQNVDALQKPPLSESDKRRLVQLFGRVVDYA